MNGSAASNIDLLTEDHLARISDQRHPPRVPRDAASLVLLDRSSDVPRALLGKRGKRHAFMPDLYVFPGGRRDPGDNKTPLAQPLREEVADKLMQRTAARFHRYAARGLAVAAAREMQEEAHLSLTPPEYGGALRPDVSHFRYLARAITPPGQSRRFDTRFFACFCDELGIDPTRIRDSDELHDLSWIPVNAHDSHPLPRITKVILSDLVQALDEDSTLLFGRSVPFYYFRNGRFVREMI
ncbi:NUDIX hydrolase [Hoeflea ulvae]|uniref:NUDIX hydrolase n=1 Tax=Hoeflea ulvae TaxID=2983764 RepID=A0ABT3YFJ3_9HYPH|nr:NUDIX hydrolase [Hoeflea ulvae]MCY0094657.1 NUDIX hydrolase [Hoeflea ulvae]